MRSAPPSRQGVETRVQLADDGPMKPTLPCAACGGRSFGVVKNVRLDLVTSAKKGFGNVLHAMFTLVVCAGCGASVFHAKPELLEDLEHERVSVG